ncbi:hypothetical protein HYZ64_01875, partial [Candidatus Berkelbacteria bacterium]|nr:hypothetical protein [Candidatus Berkelbacteria bacterium]
MSSRRLEKTGKTKRRVILGEEEKDLLLSLAAIGGTLALAVVSLPLAAMFSKFATQYIDQAPDREQVKHKQRIERMLRQLRRKRLVHISHIAGGYELQVTEQGRRRIRLIQLAELTIEQPQLWDGVWRVVGFDIAETHRQARDSLRDLLKQLGFYKLQKSVWVLPWPCRDELEVIREAYGLGQELWYAEALVLDQEARLRNWYQLL